MTERLWRVAQACRGAPDILLKTGCDACHRGSGFRRKRLVLNWRSLIHVSALETRK